LLKVAQPQVYGFLPSQPAGQKNNAAPQGC
jgi:hypothetical protein